VDRAGFEPAASAFRNLEMGVPRFYISSRCVNAISEFLEYDVEVKERDHAVDGIRYEIPFKSALPPLNAFRFE
jgi:hypothetical protein